MWFECRPQCVLRSVSEGRSRRIGHAFDLLRGLEQWLKESGLTQTQAAKALGITQARVSDIKRGKFGQFSLDMLVRLASRAGLKPRLKLAA